MRWLVLLGVLAAAPSLAGTIVATRPIPAHSVILAHDVAISAGEVAGAAAEISEVLGKEARVTLYPGRPILHADLGPPAIVDRNDIVRLVFRSGSLSILAEGRALDRGAAGERIRIMNIDSRAIVTGVLQENKTVEVRR